MLPNRLSRCARPAAVASFVVLLGALVGCSTPLETASLAGGITTAIGAHSPNNEIEQTYYLGVFDPAEQVPPTVYRVRVHGQASAMSFTRFASGWVHASVIDSLGSNLTFNNETGAVEFSKESNASTDRFKTGRGLMMFGPEGFRPAPRDHRLVIMMGSSPAAYFEAFDEVLGQAARAATLGDTGELSRALMTAVRRSTADRASVKTASDTFKEGVAPLEKAPATSNKDVASVEMGDQR